MVLKPSDITFNRQEIQSLSVNRQGYLAMHSWLGIPLFPDGTLGYIMSSGRLPMFGGRQYSINT
jgi:hypothetical protein